MCSDERQFQPLVMTQSPSTSIPTTFPSSSNLRSAWLTFLSGFELSLVLLITTFLKFPALSATLILRVWASRGVVVLLMANSTKPGKTSTYYMYSLYSQCIKSGIFNHLFANIIPYMNLHKSKTKQNLYFCTCELFNGSSGHFFYVTMISITMLKIWTNLLKSPLPCTWFVPSFFKINLL